MEIPFKSAHYEIIRPDENDLIFYFDAQEVFLISSERIPIYREFSQFSIEVEHFYCFAEKENVRYLLAEDVKDFPENPDFSKVSLRKLTNSFSEDLFWLLLKASHLNYWRKTHRYCGLCGTKLSEFPEERARRCENCLHVTYPRISPCIIVLVTRGEEMLLARSAHFPADVYSTLAGFIEPGESAEETLQREVFEEVGVYVKNIQYFGSQAWPFPDSLMLGFTAEYASGEIQIDEKEIEDANWYSPDDLPTLPNTFSIARALIEAHLEKCSNRDCST